MPDAPVLDKAAQATAAKAKIMAACQNAYCLMKIDCSGFVKAVASALNVPLSEGNADSIRDFLLGHPDWKSVGSGSQAASEADSGRFVLACLKAKDHSPAKNNGHVVVVVPGPLYKNTYPKCYGGSLKSNAALQADGCYEDPTYASSGDKSTGEVWGPGSRDKVEYYAYQKDV